MAKTWEDLKAYVKANEADNGYVEECSDEAVEGVDNLATGLGVPQATLERCYIEAGEKLFNRRSAVNGQAQFASLDGQPVLTAKDPYVMVYPILKKYSKKA